MSALEARFRRALRFYPSGWRSANEAVVLSTLLDAAEAAGRTRPRALEVLNLAANGIRARFALVGGGLSAEARGRASALSLAMGTAFAVVSAVLSELNLSAIRALEGGWSIATFGPFLSVGVILYALWPVAYVAALVGFSRVARGLAAATIPMAVIVLVVSDRSATVLRPTATSMGLLALLSLLVVVGDPTRGRRGRPLLVIAGAASGAVLLAALQVTGSFHYAWGGDIVYRGRELFAGELGQWIGWLVAATVLTALVLSGAGRRDWAAALALVAMPWLALALFGGRDADVILSTCLGMVVLFVGGIAAWLLLRAAGFRIHLTRRYPTKSP